MGTIALSALPRDATNTLIIMSDQHNSRFMGCAGHPLVKTPNLDKLAERGTHFANAYTPSPICVPARAAFATGDWVHRIRYWDNAIAYDGHVGSFGHRLQHAGIPITAIGKLHYRRLEDDAGFDEQIIPMHIAEGIGQVWGLVRDPLPVRPHGERMLSAAGPGLSKYNRYDLAVTDRAVRWLEEAAARTPQRPWVLYVGLVAPHFPYVVPEPYFSLYDQEAFKRAIPHPADGWKPHPWVQKFLGAVPGIDHNTDAERRRCTAAYLGLCSFLDANVGAILDTLDRTGLAPSTRVIYTSDHGDQVGSRGHWGKSLPYEASVSVPLIVAGPDLPCAKQNLTAVNLVDLHPTILNSAGLSAVADKPGRSLLEIANQIDDHGRPQFSEYHAYGATSAWFMLRRGRYKYIDFMGFAPELYDLCADPLEQNNIADLAEEAAVRTSLATELRTFVDPEAADAAARADQRQLIARYGGIGAALSMGTPGETPTPL